MEANDRHHRARGVDSTQAQTAVRLLQSNAWLSLVLLKINRINNPSDPFQILNKEPKSRTCEDHWRNHHGNEPSDCHWEGLNRSIRGSDDINRSDSAKE
jgi:hypothetical protein